MPVKRRMIKTRNVEISDAEWAVMTDTKLPEDMNKFTRMQFEHFGRDNREVRALWERAGEEALEFYIDRNPGCRPKAWWYWTAPQEPRLRVGGAGTPNCNFDSFTFGIPLEYSGSWLGLDHKDPPRFESQASFLQRHGLLTQDELLQLKQADFEPEVFTFEWESKIDIYQFESLKFHRSIR